jgi:multidrug efflux pump subunit AcrA (membrane-fusion protein)
MNVLLDYQIILLPKKNYWKWVRACSSYVMRFGANLTDDPSTAMGYMAPGQVITFPSGEGLFPEHADVAAWLQDAAPGVRLDPLDAKTPKEFRASLKKRIETDDRYGQKQRPFYLVWPTDYPVITQAFGANPQIYTRFGMPGHEGLDIRALTNTSVYSCADGSVYEVHTNPKDHPYGIHVRVRHKDGYRTVYGHLLRALVSVGESVKAGQVLGKADSTGASTAAHLHLTLERDGATARKETKYPKDVVDPTPFMVWPDRSSKKGLPSEVWPAGRCLIGAYGGLGRPLSKDEISLVRTAAAADASAPVNADLLKLRQAQLDVQTAQTALDDTVLKSPISGTVLSVDATVGQSVGSSSIITVADLSHPGLQVNFDETDLAQVQIGNTVNVTFDAYPNQTFSGKITQVEPQLVTVEGVQTVQAVVVLDSGSAGSSPSAQSGPAASSSSTVATSADPAGTPTPAATPTNSPQLFLGLNATVQVISAEARNVLLVPIEAVHELSAGSYGVFVMVDGQPQLRVVQVGLESLTSAEITSGLQRGDVVTTGVVQTQSQSGQSQP